MATTPQTSGPEPEPSVVLALQAMGLDWQDFRESIQAAHDSACRTTNNDVATLGGTLRWAVPLRYLGDVYVPKGFTRERHQGFETLRSPDETFEIAVVAGSSGTGQRDKWLYTRTDCGPITGQAVEGNRAQIRFDSNVIPFGPRESRPDATPDRLVWFLVHCFDESKNELRAELSLPVEFKRSKKRGVEHGTVTRFDPRLILPAISLATTADILDEDDGDDEIDIPIQRR